MDKCECAAITDLLPDYLNRVLAGEETVHLLKHLAVCENCRSEAAFLITLKNAAGSLAADVPENIMRSAFKKINDESNACDSGDVLTVSMAFGFVRDALFTARKAVKFAYHSISI